LIYRDSIHEVRFQPLRSVAQASVCDASSFGGLGFIGSHQPMLQQGIDITYR